MTEQLKKEIEEKALLKYCSPDGKPNPETYAYIAGATHYAEKMEKLQEEITRLTMDNMTHEYNQAESEKFAPEYERQIREDERAKCKDKADKLAEALRNLIFTSSKLWDGEKNIKDTEFITVTHPIIEEAKQALREYEG